MAIAMVWKSLGSALALREGGVLGQLQFRFRGNARGKAGSERLGAMVITRTPMVPRSRAMVRVMPAIPAFAAV